MASNVGIQTPTTLQDNVDLLVQFSSCGLVSVPFTAKLLSRWIKILRSCGCGERIVHVVLPSEVPEDRDIPPFDPEPDSKMTGVSIAEH